MLAAKSGCLKQRAVHQAALALAACAAVALAPRCAWAQQRPADVPVLTVPTGLPPVETPAPNPLEALLQAAGVTPPLDAAAAGAAVQPAPRSNPFASPTPPAAPTGPNVLLPFNPARGASNVAVDKDADGLISLQVREGSLRQVVAMIAETQNLNIVFAGPGDVTVSASFDKQPWQTVLDSLVSASGHTWTTTGNIIFVSSLEVADFMPPAAGGQQVHVFELDFASAVDVDQAVKGMLSPAGRSWFTVINPQSNSNTVESVTVADYPAYLARISQFICQVDQPPRQVLIQAHILQVTLDDTCRNGINFENIIRMSSTPIRLSNIGFVDADSSRAFRVNVDGDGQNGLDGIIELLQQTTDAKTLASPEISAVSGQFSRIQIGDQLPYRNTATTQTASLQTAQFLDVGIVLEVTARVTRDGRVLMRIRPEVSEGEYRPEAEGLPSKKTTELETDALLASGEGLVIGGLIQEIDTNQQNKLPWVGDIPYLGILFQRREVTKSRREIIVAIRPVVMPYDPIVEDIQAQKLFRAEQPLTFGAIHSYPRPYEPSMPDTFGHHKKKHGVMAPGPEYIEFDPSAVDDLEPMELPAIEEEVQEELSPEETELPANEELPAGPTLESAEPAMK
jgi:type IV pilus assembly protein PilQ